MSRVHSLFSVKLLVLQAGFGVFIVGLNASKTPVARLFGWIAFYVVVSLLLNVVLTQMFGRDVKKDGRRAQREERGRG